MAELLDTLSYDVKSHSMAFHREPPNRRRLKRAAPPQLPPLLAGPALLRAGAKYGGDRPELVSLGTHRLAAAAWIDGTRLCDPNHYVDSPRRRRRRSCRPKTHHDFFPTRFSFHLLHSRYSGNRRMDRLVACNDLGLFIGVHQSLRPAEPYGPAATDGA